MPKTVDNYIIKKQLFKDSFEIEYLLCEHKVLRKPFTLKKIQKPSDDCNSKQEEKRRVKLSFVYSCLQNQIQILRQLKSEKVIKCLKILKAKNAVYAVYDEHPDKTLQKIISTEYLTIERKQTILNEIVQLVRQIHEQNIAIGNLEPRNIYFTSDNKILISNFLISKKVQQFESVKVDQFFLEHTSKFYAPQLLETGSLSKAADIYSIGQIIKKLKIEKSENQLLSPTKFCYDSIKEIVERMIDENPRLRPSIVEFDKTFGLNRSRNKSTCGSNGSRDNEDKMADVRGLEGCKSEAVLKIFSSKADQSTVVHFDSKKALLSKRQTLNKDPVELRSTKKILLKSRATIQSQFPLQSLHMATLDVPSSIRKSRGVESSRSGKSAGLSSTYNSQSGFIKGSFKQKFQQMMLMRNLVSFLIQMTLFVYNEEGSKQLCYCLIQQAIKYTSDKMKIVESLMNEETGKKDSFMTFVEECQKEKRKLNEISFFFTSESQNKGHEDVTEELKKFGKAILNLYSSDFSIQSKGSQVSDAVSKSKQVIDHQKSKQKEEKLFKTFMVLKRLEYGNYFDFFKAKVHHSNKKFWNEHYFEFEKTFGGKYFAIQIKDLITRK